MFHLIFFSLQKGVRDMGFNVGSMPLQMEKLWWSNTFLMPLYIFLCPDLKNSYKFYFDTKNSMNRLKPIILWVKWSMDDSILIDFTIIDSPTQVKKLLKFIIILLIQLNQYLNITQIISLFFSSIKESYIY